MQADKGESAFNKLRAGIVCKDLGHGAGIEAVQGHDTLAGFLVKMDLNMIHKILHM